MNIKIIYAVALIFILVSIQWTLNLILQEIRNIRISVRNYEAEKWEDKSRR